MKKIYTLTGALKSRSMNKICLIITCLLAALTSAYAQKEILHLKPDCGITNSNFNKVIIINNKKDTADFGFIKIGAFNKNVKVKFKTAFGDELKQFHLDAVNAAAKKEGTLAINVRKFSLSQKTGIVDEKGFFRYSADYFISPDDIHYVKVYSVDSTYIHRSMEVTGQTMEGVSIHLCENLKSFTNINTDTTGRELFTLEALEKFK